MRAVSIFAGCVLSAILVPAVAVADSIDATRYEIIERSHAVELKVDRGFATLVVQRVVANTGPKSDQATFHLDIPDTAVATRLRTAGVNARGETIWFEGELMEAESAAKKYEELTGIGGYYPKDPALLSWRSQGSLALQVFPVPAQSTKTVEYTLKMPLTYEHGAYHVELPAMGTEAMPARVHITAAHTEDRVTVNGISVADGGIVARAEKGISIELRPRGVPLVDTALASVPIADDLHLVRGSIAAAPHLGEAPYGAHVVVLFDGSRSHHDAEAGLVAVRAYLGHMPGATVDFLTFDREVRAPIGRSLPVASALAKLAGFQIEPRNGSRIDDALARADAILQASSVGPAARRVVVVTDTLTRSELTPAILGAASWKSGAVVHVASVGHGPSSVIRDDDSPWMAFPRRTGGLFWRGTASFPIDASARSVFEEWARPKRIDKLEIKGVSGTFTAPETLDEGEGIDHFVLADAATTRVEITGELWSKPLRTVATPTAERGKLASALVFGSPLWSQLSEVEQMKLALLGGAVSPVTSYLAIEPGVRPSNEGLDWGAVGSGGGGGVGHGFGTGSGRLFGSGVKVTVDKNAWLRAQLLQALMKCAPSSKAATATLESTLDEIVDVGRVELSPARDAKNESCVREALWGVALPSATFANPFEAFTVEAKL
ncbi:MAG: hypothetical protein QOI41_3858 [Myxococcales bacterium]|nr:hypothetical protein [Myxococcales bacterium]